MQVACTSIGSGRSLHNDRDPDRARTVAGSLASRAVRAAGKAARRAQRPTALRAFNCRLVGPLRVENASRTVAAG